MANKHDITSATSRSRLTPRREPYWRVISKGLAVGYRVTKSFDGGIWQARWRDPETGKHLTCSLGQFTDITSADGRKTEERAIDQATNAALRWAADVRVGVQNVRATLWDACEHYIKTALSNRPKAKKAATTSFNYRIKSHPIGKVAITNIQRRHLRDWMQDCVDMTLAKTEAEADDPDALRRARDSANRDFRHLRAALNLAVSDGMAGEGCKAAWSTGVAFAGTTKSRDNYLTNTQTQAWIEATPAPLSDFLRGLMLTAARPGELALARVQDFDAQAGTLTLRTGKRKENHSAVLRTIPLQDAAIDLLKRISKAKIARAPLFADPNGNPWTRQTWQPCRDSAAIAGLPNGTIAYDLRHAAISRWLAGGLSVFEVAKLAGTSVDMIEKHYGHLLQGVTANRLDKAAAATAEH